MNMDTREDDIWAKQLRPMSDYSYPQQSATVQRVFCSTGPENRSLHDPKEIDFLTSRGWIRADPIFSLNSVVEFADPTSSCTIFSVTCVMYSLVQTGNLYAAIPVYQLNPPFGAGNHRPWVSQEKLWPVLNMKISSSSGGKLVFLMNGGVGSRTLSISINNKVQKSQLIQSDAKHFAIENIRDRCFSIVLTDSLSVRLVLVGRTNFFGELIPSECKKMYTYVPRQMMFPTLAAEGACICCRSNRANMLLFSEQDNTCGHICYCTDCAMMLERKCSVCGFIGKNFNRVISNVPSMQKDAGVVVS